MMNNIISDEFPIDRPNKITMLHREGGNYIEVMLMDEEHNKQFIRFYDCEENYKCIMKRMSPIKEDDILYSETYHDNKLKSMFQFLSDTLSRFDQPPSDAMFQVEMPLLPTELYNIPYIQLINCYKFTIRYEGDSKVIDFLDQLDPNKKIIIFWLPLNYKDELYNTATFKRFKNIKCSAFGVIDTNDFLESEAEILDLANNFRINTNEAINLKIKKWISDTNVEYKSITINFLDKNYGWIDENIKVIWDVVLHGISVVDKVDNNGTDEYIIQRSDGTVAKLSFKQNTFQFTNEGKKAMMAAKNDESIDEHLFLPIGILEKIATYFDIKTQRRFVQTCRRAEEIVRRSNRVWPNWIEYSRFDMFKNRNGIGIVFGYDSEKCDAMYFQKYMGEVFASPTGFSEDQKYIKIVSGDGTELALEDVTDNHLFERLKYLKDDCSHRLIMTFGGEKWPTKLFDTLYFKRTTRYVFGAVQVGEIILFLEKIGSNKEIVIGKVDGMTIGQYDTAFFGLDVVQKLKHLEMNRDCEITGRQFIDFAAEVFQIQVKTMAELAVNGKIKKWLDKKQNIKYFGIIMKNGRDDYSIEEVLDGIEYVKTEHKDKFKEPYKGFKIQRNDGIDGELLVSHKRIVFFTKQLPIPPVSFMYESYIF